MGIEYGMAVTKITMDLLLYLRSEQSSIILTPMWALESQICAGHVCLSTYKSIPSLPDGAELDPNCLFHPLQYESQPMISLFPVRRPDSDSRLDCFFNWQVHVVHSDETAMVVSRVTRGCRY